MPLQQPTILQVLPSLVTGGVERGTIEITEAITRAGGRALVASEGGRLVAAIEAAGGHHVRLPLATKNPSAIWSNAARLESLIRSEGVSIVHARSRAPAWSAWLACRRTRTHFVTTYHGAYSENLPLKRQYNGVMAWGEIVIAASRFIADLIRRRHGVPQGRIRVIPRGVDPAVFDPGAVAPGRLSRLATDWKLPAGKRVVMLPGRLTAWKGHAVLLDALARLQRQDFCVVLVGSDQGRTHYMDQLFQQAKRLGVVDRVRLGGDCDDMPAALLLADLVVHASTQAEAFGRVVIEAQAMGRAVIASDLGGPVETVEQGVTGWRVPPGDPAALAAAIDRALDLPAGALQSLAAAARGSVLRTATVGAMQDATLAAYKEVLGTGSAVGFPVR